MSECDDSQHWYLIRVQRGKEAWAQKELEAVTTDVYLPVLVARKPGAKPIPLFPRWIFVRMTAEQRITIGYTPGVRRVGFVGHELQEVPDTVVRSLKYLEAARGGGKERTVSRGALDQELEQVFDQCLPSSERLVVLFRTVESETSKQRP